MGRAAMAQSEQSIRRPVKPAGFAGGRGVGAALLEIGGGVAGEAVDRGPERGQVDTAAVPVLVEGQTEGLDHLVELGPRGQRLRPGVTLCHSLAEGRGFGLGHGQHALAKPQGSLGGQAQ